MIKTIETDIGTYYFDSVNFTYLCHLFQNKVHQL